MKQKVIDNLLALSKNSYDKIAADFDMTRKKEIWPLIRKFTALVPSGARILDAGCGNGRLLEAFEQKEIDYLGIDNSAALISLAQKNHPLHKFLKIDLIDFQTFNLTALGNKKFDYIFCLAVLQHIPSEELRIDVLKKMSQLLADDGTMVLSNWDLWSSRHRALVIKQIWHRIIGLNKRDFGDIIFPWKNKNGEVISDRYYHAFTKRELVKLARRAGFRNIKISREGHNYWLVLK